MALLETQYDDEVTSSGVLVEDIVERMLDQEALKEILTKLVKGGYTEQRLYNNLFDLAMDVESELEGDRS